MKSKLIVILIICLTTLTSCSGPNEYLSQNDSEGYTPEQRTPINYDFDNLRLHLSDEIFDSLSSIEWRWDYMNSENGVPDSIGVDHYMNISQPLFSFNGETTLPSISVATRGNRIEKFSSTIIFNLNGESEGEIESLLDSLSIIDLLLDDTIRRKIIDDHEYRASNSNYEESIDLMVSDDEYGYDRITYEIKERTHNNR